MTTKQLLPNQCNDLHRIYGSEDCCLCKERRELSIQKDLAARYKELFEVYAKEQVRMHDKIEALEKELAALRGHKYCPGDVVYSRHLEGPLVVIGTVEGPDGAPCLKVQNDEQFYYVGRQEAFYRRAE